MKLLKLGLQGMFREVSSFNRDLKTGVFATCFYRQPWGSSTKKGANKGPFTDLLFLSIKDLQESR